MMAPSRHPRRTTTAPRPAGRPGQPEIGGRPSPGRTPSVAFILTEDPLAVRVKRHNYVVVVVSSGGTTLKVPDGVVGDSAGL
jgi:hypothetical protein